MSKPTILCVDDEVDNIDSLERLFRRKYNVLKALSGEEALQILSKTTSEISVIVTDQRMPGMTGVELLQASLSTHPETIRMLLTGYTDLESVITAVNEGQIYRYLTKPWDPVDLTNTLDRAVERYNIGNELKNKNKELQRANEELKTLDIAKSNFMILVNHELKTPLTSILNFLALLDETSLDSEQKLFTNRIKQSSNRLHQLIDDVLLIVRSETEQLKIDIGKHHTLAIKEMISVQVQKSIADKQQALDWQIEPADIDVDIKYLKEVLNRLTHNANKFGSQQSHIVWSAKKIEQHVYFSITNEGSQISEKVIDKIFSPFFIDENIMNHSVGMGLGLTICQALLRQMDSGLNIKNEKNSVTISFSLPLSANK
jgi:two-component system, sensor histidine kinase and response regulator